VISRRKYTGPCHEHAIKKHGCKHCAAYYMQRRYYHGEPPPEKKPDPAYRRPRQDAEIFSALHWPAPELL